MRRGGNIFNPYDTVIEAFCGNTGKRFIEEPPIRHLPNPHLTKPAVNHIITCYIKEVRRALSMPPIPWDVQLGNWFDEFFAPLARHCTYARPSRRQGSTHAPRNLLR